MKYYFAPMEGLTDSIHRRIFHRYFSGIDRYMMPFLSPTQTHCLSSKEKRELPPRNADLDAVPQILTRSDVDFLWAAECCAERGYEEVNLNIGCPSGTVVAKGKGAGMLADLTALERFLDSVFARCPLAISVKTRLGMESAEEFASVLECLNRYPIKELSIHPRVRKQFYKGTVALESFAYGMEHSRAPVCYNGDICTPADIAALQRRFPNLQAVMIGRALIGNPFLLCGEPNRKTLLSFHGELLEEYCRVFGERKHAMCRMKEHWHMLLCLFENSEKLGKQLKKASRYEDFCAVSTEILTQLPLRKQLLPAWREENVFAKL